MDCKVIGKLRVTYGDSAVAISWPNELAGVNVSQKVLNALESAWKEVEKALRSPRERLDAAQTRKQLLTLAEELGISLPSVDAPFKTLWEYLRDAIVFGDSLR